MKITASFKRQFEWETVQSEKLRAAILSGYSLLTFACILIISLSTNLKGTENTGERSLPYSLLIFLFGLFLYELLMNRILKYQLNKGGRFVRPSFKYITALVELGTITLMLYAYSFYFKNPLVLSDVTLVSLYYLIVFMSAFYLDKMISIVTGFIAAVSYTLLHILQQVNVTEGGIEALLYNNYFIYATGVLLFLCGIAAAFMAHQLQKGIRRSVELVEEEHRIFNLFSRQISREVAKEMLDKDGNLPSELKYVGVMFIDIRNFTAYAETQTPEDLVKFQNKFFGVIIDSVNKYHGIVNQFLGDGCMITFGAPITIENPAANAVHAALEIKESIQNAIKREETHHFEIGIGIHSGDAVCGNIGTSTKSEYSITGGVVILAARIEQLNKLLGSHILISKEAFENAAIDSLEPNPVGEASLKGWSHPVEVYKLA
ncbi:MAG: adenylate/guanylate cyclase domain-containing protein [Chitinophagaceae bacterium]